jgi:hypothetical protein
MSVRRSLALALVAALVLAGCQDEPEPRFDPPSESSSPSDPATSDEPEAQTAEEFIEEWFRVNTHMQNTGDAEAFLGISPACRPCRDLADQVTGFYRAGGFIRIEFQDVISIRRLSDTEFLANVDAATTRYKRSASDKAQTLPGGPNEYRIKLGRVRGTWEMREFMDTPS